MTLILPNVADVVAGIIGLACQGGEQLRIPQIYSTLCELKGKRQILLSGLSFSITGSVCYSRTIEETLRALVARGILDVKDRDTLIVAGKAPAEVRKLLPRPLPRRIYLRLLSISRAFYRRMPMAG
jgi:hypothetical protein